jgi:hypothetical protein
LALLFEKERLVKKWKKPQIKKLSEASYKIFFN